MGNAYILSVLRKTPVGSRGGVFYRGNVSQTQISKTKKEIANLGYTLRNAVAIDRWWRLASGCKVVIPEVLIGEVNFGLST